MMHIDRTYQVTMTCEPAGEARPISPSGLVAMPAARTPAAGSSFGAGEARDAGLLGFVHEVGDVLAIFPQRHPLVMIPPARTVAHAVGVADEEASHLLIDAEVDDLPGSLMAKITHTPLRSAADLVLGALQFFPAAGGLLTPGLLLGELAELLAPLPLEGTDTASGHQ
jgi:hypothetical protein